MPLLKKEQRQDGYYFGGYCDGYYLIHRNHREVAEWAWRKPTQAEVDEAIKRDQQQRREQ